MNRARRPPLQHPLAHRFERAVTSLGAALHPDTLRHYRGTVRYFPTYLGSQHPKVRRLDQLSRDPHILGWLAQLRSQKPPLAIGSFINLLIHLRGVFTELAWTQLQPHLDHLLRPEDVPRLPHRLPRPLTAQQDQQLEQESIRRNDWGANTFLLIRHIGMRIGECADLPATVCMPSARINGQSRSLWASSRPNEWSRWTPSSPGSRSRLWHR